MYVYSRPPVPRHYRRFQQRLAEPHVVLSSSEGHDDDDDDDDDDDNDDDHGDDDADDADEHDDIHLSLPTYEQCGKVYRPC